jgi:hypothetical protein
VISDIEFPSHIVIARGLVTETHSCPYAGKSIEYACNDSEKYVRWIILEAALFPPTHEEYQEGLKTFINNLITYYNQMHDIIHQFPLRDYLAATELI